MTRFLHRLAALVGLALLMAACSQNKGDSIESSSHRSVYYWKTTFNLSEQDLSFLEKHSIDRIYLRMFDVDTKNDYVRDTHEVVPIATCSFDSAKPDSIEIVPTVFITLNALRAYEGKESVLAGLITKRVLNMCSYNGLGPVTEIQFDCDWTESTRAMYVKLCKAAKDILHPQEICLSGTIRLHQVAEAIYPFDKGVLMLYNTGAIKDPETSNSIIAYDDVKRYLGVKSRIEKFNKARKDNCPEIDFAYPTYCWNVAFTKDGRFDGILPMLELDGYPELKRHGNRYDVIEYCKIGSNYLFTGQTIRPEFAEYSEVAKVKNLVESTLGKTGSNILFHLDASNLSKYSDNEIETILK